MQLRVRALETILTEKGYIDPAALDLPSSRPTRPRSARTTARASSPRPGSIRPSSRRCSRTPRKAIAELGHVSRVGDHLIAVENTPQSHNMIVCTLCSCYPWEVLGLPPVWYKSAPYRSRAVNDPRGVLADFGVDAAEGHRNPGLGFDRRDALPRAADAARRHRGLERGEARRARHPRLHDRHRPAEEARRGRMMDGIHDMGGMHGFGKVEPEPNEPLFHAPWEGRVLAMNARHGLRRRLEHRQSRFAQEQLPPPIYLAASYYQSWALRLEKHADRARLGRRRRDRRPAMRCGRGKPLKRKLTADDVERRRSTRGRSAAQTQRAGPLQGRRPRAHQEHPSAHPHAAAALCARTRSA